MHRGLLDDVVRAVQRTGRRSGSPSLAGLLLGPAAALGFWASRALPLTYIPLFLGGVIDGAVAAQLVAGHAVAVVVGHSYGR